MYRHVDVLNANGIPAAIIHRRAGFRVTWFENATAIMDLSGARPTTDDFIMVPEQIASQVTTLWPGVPKVIFNQNAYETFAGHAIGPGELATPLRHPDFIATIVVSQDSKRYLEYAFPEHPTFRIHYGIDPRFFHYEPHKTMQITYMPRKNLAHILQVVSILKARRALEGVELYAIDRVAEAETARLLRQSVLFLSFGGPEGFGLPAAEAMACGCIVVGYDGQGGREFITPQYAFPIDSGDIIGFAATAERVIRMLREDPQSLAEMARRASEFVLGTYTPKREEEDILQVWRHLLARPRAIPPRA